MDPSSYWKKCSSCKKPIPFSRKYYVCNVKTCQHSRRGFQFCSVSCWDAHVPIMRHKESWAEERMSPKNPELGSFSTSSTPVRRVIRPENSPNTSSQSPQKATLPNDILVVVSKMKLFIKELSGFNTSADVNERLSDHIRALCVKASKRTSEAGRKTVMARDFDDV